MSSLLENATIKVRRDTAGNWTSNNPTLNQGEWGYETDTGFVKIGDGSTAWTSLGYIIGSTYVMNDLTAGDIIYALPTAVGFTSEITLEWENGVPTTNELSFTTVSAQTINGSAASVWLGQGEGIIVLYSDGSNWRVKEYSDAVTISANWSGVVKNRDGKYNSGIHLSNASNITEASLYAIFDEVMKTVGDEAMVSGYFQTGGINRTANHLERTDAATFILKTFNVSGGALNNRTFTSTASGSWTDTNITVMSIVLSDVSWK